MKNNFLKDSFHDDEGRFCVTCINDDGRYIRMRMTDWEALWWFARLHWRCLLGRWHLSTDDHIPLAGEITEHGEWPLETPE